MEWSNLPRHILVAIFKNFNSASDLHHASLANHEWHQAFRHPTLWADINLTFASGEKGEKYLQVIPQFGHLFRTASIHVAQENEVNRHLALRALNMLESMEQGQIESLKVRFIGQNPLFYGGQEFTTAIQQFTSCVPKNSLRSLLLGGLYGKISDEMLDSLTANQSESLEHLDVQNKQLVCQVSPEGMALTVETCKHLTTLEIFSCSMSDRMIRSLCEPGRAKLKHLSLYCSAQDKFNDDYDVPDTTWQVVRSVLPELQVTAIIDPRLWGPRIPIILQPSLPLHRFHLITERIPRQELELVGNQYGASLRHLYLNTATSAKFQPALVQFAEKLNRIDSIRIQNKVTLRTCVGILDAHPHLRETKNYVFFLHEVDFERDDITPYVPPTDDIHSYSLIRN